MADLHRMKKRLSDFTSGKAKLERLIAADPKSARADGMRKRLAEYETGIAGLTPQIAALEGKPEKPAK